MQFLGFELKRVGSIERALSAVDNPRAWSPRIVWESFTGAWQRNITASYADLLSYPALFACISRIAQDVGKLPFLLVRETGGIWFPVAEASPFWPVLRKPNYYQTAQQFRESWIVSKLVQGNSYILKERDARGIVRALYVLDPCRVQPMVSDETGDVFYKVGKRGAWNLPPLPAGFPERENAVVIPAREIIHDRANTFHHPLIGVPPVCASQWAAVKNLGILRNSSKFFENGANPGGILTAPAGISREDAAALTTWFNENFTGENSGKTGVIGADLKYTQFGIKAADAQLVEQMKYSDEQICQPFGVKPYKIGIGNPPAGWKADDINVEYYGDALSPLIESLENLLDEGLAIAAPQGVEVDTAPLWRMDEGKLAEVETKLVGGKVKTPDEARSRFNLKPTGGGDTLWGQHQDYPLAMLAEREDLDPVAPEPEPEPAPADPELEAAAEERALLLKLWRVAPESLTCKPT